MPQHYALNHGFGIEFASCSLMLANIVFVGKQILAPSRLKPISRRKGGAGTPGPGLHFHFHFRLVTDP